ncbi:hypothetical protein [Largemouth bass virus]|nr:hypothetical protein [Largemouth bass virus]WEI29014.1 hypothetical protein [Largemouth bass virus]
MDYFTTMMTMASLYDNAEGMSERGKLELCLSMMDHSELKTFGLELGRRIVPQAQLVGEPLLRKLLTFRLKVFVSDTRPSCTFQKTCLRSNTAVQPKCRKFL